MNPDIPGYSIHSLLGRGGMASVYAATSPSGREVALKCIATPQDRHRLRARREIEVLAELRHPAIVALLDHGTSEGATWFAMERGMGSLSEHPPQTGDQLHTIVRQILSALIHAHSRSILHRDLKPSNIVRTTVGGVCIADFGVARLGDAPVPAQVGTRGFMAPEQRRGDAWDQGPWTDLYALGRMVQQWWPNAPQPWQSWIHWLTEPASSHRPCLAAHALAALPDADDAPLKDIPVEPTLPTAPVVSPTPHDDRRATWRSAPLPARLPRARERADRTPRALAGLCRPPLFGRDALLDDIWSAATSHDSAARHVRVSSRPGLGSTACLEELRTRIEQSGVRTWNVRPDDSPHGVRERITGGEYERWKKRFYDSASQARLRDRPSASLVAFAAAEPGPLVVLCDHASADVQDEINALGQADLDVVIIDFGRHPDATLHLEPLPPATLHAAVGKWLDTLDAEILQVERALGTHPGWFFRALRSAPSGESDVHIGLAILAWWAGSASDFIGFCEGHGIELELERWFAEGTLSASGDGLHFTDPRTLTAARKATPSRLEPCLDDLLPHLSDAGTQGQLLAQFGRIDEAITTQLAFGTELIQAASHRRLENLLQELDPLIAPEDPRRERWLSLFFSCMHHVDHDFETIEAQARALVEGPSRPARRQAAHYLATRLQRRREHEDALAVLERVDPEHQFPEFVGSIAGLYFDQGRYEAVEELNRVAIGVSATTRAEAALMSGDPDLSEQIAREHLPDAGIWDSMSFHNVLGAVAVERGDLPEAEAAFRRAAEFGAGLFDVLQPLTNAAAVATMRGEYGRAAREASQLLPRLEHWRWNQNIGWCCLVLWASHEDPDEAERSGRRAREIFERPEMESQARLASIAAQRLARAGRPELARRATGWAAKLES